MTDSFPRRTSPRGYPVLNLPKARVCFGCKRTCGVFAYHGAYWHLRCFRRAPAMQREAARLEMQGEE